MTNTPNRLLVAAVTTLILFAAACGSGAEPASLPVNDQPDDTPIAVGTCVQDEPDCVDTVVDEEPRSLPNDSAASSGMPVDGGLTVSDALASGTEGILAISGFVLDDGETARLCEALAESFPPQCGGASIPLVGYQPVLAGQLTQAQGVAWTDQAFIMFGEVLDGTFVVESTVDG